jgi:hypothetical protein
METQWNIIRGKMKILCDGYPTTQHTKKKRSQTKLGGISHNTENRIQVSDVICVITNSTAALTD